MNNEKLQSQIEDLRRVTLTSLEKKNIKERIFTAPSPRVLSPYGTFTFFASHKRKISMTFAVLLIIVFGGTGLASAAGRSLPGDLLYSMKVRVIEPVVGSFKPSLTAKADYEISLSTARLIEARTLIEEGRFDSQKETEVTHEFVLRSEAFNQTIREIRQEKPEEDTDGLVSSFRAELGAHARTLDLVRTSVDHDEQLGASVSMSAREKAHEAKTLIRKNVATDEAYQKRKHYVETIIDSTKAKIAPVADGAKDADVVTTGASDTLKEADDLLKKSNTSNESGDKDEAYKALMESETSAKEADIFLKTPKPMQTAPAAPVSGSTSSSSVPSATGGLGR